MQDDAQRRINAAHLLGKNRSVPGNVPAHRDWSMGDWSSCGLHTHTSEAPISAAELERYLFRQLNPTIRVTAINPNHGSRHIAGRLRRE